jgi:uncharacterized protein YndB with AHSA1/START domain
MPKPLQAKTQIKISKPIHEVFQALIDPEQVAHYWYTSASGKLEEGKTVTWFFGDVGPDVKVDAVGKKIETDHRISFTWNPWGNEGIVEITLEAQEDGRTLVKVVEDGWDKDDKGIAALADNTQGWVGFLIGLKGWLEYRINLRKGAI